MGLQVEPRCGGAASRHLQFVDRVFGGVWRVGRRPENVLFVVSDGPADSSGLAYSLRSVRQRERRADRAGGGGLRADEQREGEGVFVDSAVQQQDFCIANVGVKRGG